MEHEMTTIQIYKKDKRFLDTLKRKHLKVGIYAVMNDIIKVIKFHKIEDEIK